MAVSKAPVDVALRPTDARWHGSPDAPGMATRVERVPAIPPTLSVLEAPGGLEVPGAGALAAAARPVVGVPPRHARAFANATGRVAKTATLDARGLAPVAAAGRPTPRPRPAADARALRALVTRRRQVGQMRTAARPRRQRTPQRRHADSQAHLAWLERRWARRDHDWAEAIRARPRWRVHDEMLPSPPGVGPVLARPWVAEVPDVGALHCQASATLVGVAPCTRASSTWRGQRSIGGGRAHVRAVLYLRPWSAVRHHPVLQAFYERRRAAGQAAKVAWTASMRQLRTLLNAMIKQCTRWQETTAETS
jgi:transposase